MKIGLAGRLSVVIALIGVLATGLTGYYGYVASRQMLVLAAEERLLTATRVLARQLTVGLNGAARDVLLIAEHPGAAMLLEPVNAALPAPSDINTALLFQRLLDTHPEYFQMRLISAAEHGLERIRVDRDDAGVLRIIGTDLQEKGHYPYVFETLRLPRGAVYVSSASINHEVGAHAGHGKPSLQVAAPVYDPHEQVRGLVVINVDLQGLFRQLSADLPSALQLYLLNSKGDYLIHPDPAKAFAFDRGQSENVQQQFPETLALLDGSTPRLHERVTRSTGAAGRVAAFVRQPPIDLRLEEEFIIGLSQPLGEVLKEGDRVGQVNVRLVLAFSALAVLLAVLLARALSRPINQIVAAVRSFSAGLPAQDNALPCERSDEIGVLARSVQDMQHQIRSQFAKLQEKQAEMDRLASHDSLTGLLNRRVFLDRLEHAMAHAKRSQCRLALLFIDLDRFKPINDSLGHAAGDVLLKTLAERLQQLVRAADTVARIGGDEFIVLLDGAEDDAAIQTVADKLLAALAEPVAYGDQAMRCGASIGIARYPENGHSASELIAAADQAMYRAKTGGRQRACFASSSSVS